MCAAVDVYERGLVPDISNSLGSQTDNPAVDLPEADLLLREERLMCEALDVYEGGLVPDISNSLDSPAVDLPETVGDLPAAYCTVDSIGEAVPECSGEGIAESSHTDGSTTYYSEHSKYNLRARHSFLFSCINFSQFCRFASDRYQQTNAPVNRT